MHSSAQPSTRPSYIHRELSHLLKIGVTQAPTSPVSMLISRWRIKTLHYHRFFIIDSVDKPFKLKKRRLHIRNSEKHERYDLLYFNLPSWIPDSTMLTMWGSSERIIAVLSRYNPQHYQLSHRGLKSTNNTVQYFYSLTQSKLLTENAVVHLF